jgi:Helix-turn-helix.
VTRQTVSNWENGKSNPDIEMILQISEVLKTDPNKLIYPAAHRKKMGYKGVSFKPVLITMIAFWLLLTFGSLISIPLFRGIMGGGIEEEFLYPIYFGIMALAGLMVGCTCVILDEIRNYEYYKEFGDEILALDGNDELKYEEG